MAKNSPTVLLTGAFGNIGQYALEMLLNRGYSVRAFDVSTKLNKKVAKNFKTSILWGNITDTGTVLEALKGVDGVIHLAAIIPPKSEENPSLSYAVNVGGTNNIIAGMAHHDTKHLVYASSVAVHGHSHERPLLFIDDQLIPTDHYTAQKIECEKNLDQAGINKTILRFGAAIPLKSEVHPLTFEISLEAKLELVHPQDAATAAVNALFKEETYGKKYFIGGGLGFQMTYRTYLQQVLENIGIEMFPEQAFGSDLFHTNYMDTAEAQKVLQFQNHSFQDFLGDSRKAQGLAPYFLKIPGVAFLTRRKLLQLSRHYK